MITKNVTLVKPSVSCYANLSKSTRYNLAIAVTMIQCRLRELMAMKTRQTHSKITYDVIKEATGISKSTLARLANDNSGLISTSTLNRLCWFFSCQPGDLLIYLPDHRPENRVASE